MKFSKFLIFKIFFILIISPSFFNVSKTYAAEEIKRRKYKGWRRKGFKITGGKHVDYIMIKVP